MGTAKGQGQQPVQLCPGRARHPPGMQEVLGTKSLRIALTHIGAGPLLSDTGQKPRETTTFLTHILLRYQNQLWPYLRSLC